MGKQVMKTRGRSRIKPVYTTPLFPPELWSVAQRVSSGLPRTTNIAESWHRKLNRLISPHPGLSEVETIIIIYLLLFIVICRTA